MTRYPSSGGTVTYAYLNRCSRQKPARTLYLYTLTLTLTVVSHQVTLVCNANATASFCQVTLANVSIPIDLCLIRVYRTQHTQRAYLLYRSIVAGLSLSLRLSHMRKCYASAAGGPAAQVEASHDGTCNAPCMLVSKAFLPRG